MMELLTAKETAQRYPQWSYWSWLDMAKRGMVPHIKVGRRVFFSPESINRWLTELETGGPNLEDPPKQGVLRKVRP